MVKNVFGFLAFLAFFFAFSSPSLAQNANVIIDNSQYSSVPSGQDFEVSVKLNAAEPIVSTKIYLSFDPSLMQPETIDVEKSGLQEWLENAYFVDNGKAIVKLQAKAPVPGVKGDINVATLKLKKLKSGDGKFSVDSSSFVLNTNNKNLLSTGGVFGLTPFVVSMPFVVGLVLAIIVVAVIAFILYRRRREPAV